VQSKKKRVVVIAIDGLPYSFFPKIKKINLSSFLSDLYEKNQIHPMTTTLPPVSSVAWASFLTGVSPGEHGITGFVDREVNTYNPFVPTGSNLKAPTIYQHLSRNGLRICSLGVPATFPPEPINGIIVSGFLAPNLERAVYPKEEVKYLNSVGYRIDIDAWSARKSDNSLIEQLPRTLSARLNAARNYLSRELWDLFILHILETDRLHHFMWRQMEEGDRPAIDLFSNIYKMINDFLVETSRSIPHDTAIIILSDHGFTQLKKDVYLNRWLQDEGYLKISTPNAANLNGMDKSSKAFSMAPGRIYLHLKGKSPEGNVGNGREADNLRKNISESLLNLLDPETGAKIIEKVVDMRQEWISAEFDQSEVQLPDLMAIPFPGYELKGELSADELYGNDRFSGMHAYGDAFVYLDGDSVSNKYDITQLPSIICSYLGVSDLVHEGNHS